ncbi:Rne/Rng family ribonuclease [Tumebacillus flagellatus]|uniref:Ribonuclease G n=1 Tax=Tumebacillus flagellatus TaxID=1157490 RepID=A0A074LKM0_9BACL|nr:Rne/Rng family ribonuclease [Tumebacillus flagellatus]KEO82676.1 ribonuclease G [Tumebacillus flagellatus]
MRKQILVSQDRRELRAAILEDGRTVEYYTERQATAAQPHVGNIYKGRVANILPGMQAAFVDIGSEKNAFLYLDDALALYAGTPNPERKPQISEVLKEGQEVLVQVVKEPVGTKGARVTANISLPGRHIVLMPNSPYVGVSRRIEHEAERERIRQAAERVRDPEVGIIVRTAAVGVADQALEQDYHFLHGTWQRILRQSKGAKVPELVYRDLDLLSRSVRDFFTEDVEELWIDDLEAFESARDMLRRSSPNLYERVKLYRGRENLFAAHRVDQDLEKALKRKVWLKSGGYLVIDQTEALTVIDVNTGKFVGSSSLEETVFKTNVEATKEITRQLRLRDIGGIIIIDFIDMRDAGHKEQIVEELQKALRRDRTRSHVLGMTQLGLIEMTRKKVRQSLDEVLHRPCPTCDGKGKVLSEETTAARIERELTDYLRGADHEAVLVECHPAVAALLIGQSGQNLRRMEEEWHIKVYIKGKDSLHLAEHRISWAGTVEEVELRALPVQVGQVLSIKIDEPNVHNARDGIARLEGYVLDIQNAGRVVGRQVLVKVTQVNRTYGKGIVIEESV